MVSIIYSIVFINSMIMMWSMVKLLFIDVFLFNVDYWILVFVVEKRGYRKFFKKFNIVFFLILIIFS